MAPNSRIIENIDRVKNKIDATNNKIKSLEKRIDESKRKSANAPWNMKAYEWDIYSGIRFSIGLEIKALRSKIAIERSNHTALEGVLAKVNSEISNVETTLSKLEDQIKELESNLLEPHEIEELEKFVSVICR